VKRGNNPLAIEEKKIRRKCSHTNCSLRGH